MDWKRILAYITGSVDQELLLRNEYLVAENRILRNQVRGRLRLTDGERKTLAELGKRLGKKVLAEIATVVDFVFIKEKDLLIQDRDRKYSPAFEDILKTGGVTPILLPAQSPDLNANAERWVRSIKEECLSRMILFGERSLQKVLKEYSAHYHHERNHQGRKNILLFRLLN